MRFIKKTKLNFLNFIEKIQKKYVLCKIFYSLTLIDLLLSNRKKSFCIVIFI